MDIYMAHYPWPRLGHNAQHAKKVYKHIQQTKAKDQKNKIGLLTAQ